MLSVIHTLDYEIHGNGDGCSHALMVEPTARLLDLFDEYGAKLTIMADVAEILKFREYREQFGRDDYHYGAITRQLQDAIRRGHDVQLHLHCSYFNARFSNGKWVQDWSEYNFAGLSEERLTEVVRIGKQFLEDLLRPGAPQYECVAFRAANWAVSPSKNVVRALLANDIHVETSVFKYGRRNGLVSFDYSGAPSSLVPWPASEHDMCRRDDHSLLLEVPIYSERRWLGAFFSLNRIHRALDSRRHPVASGEDEPAGHSSRNETGRWRQHLETITRRHAWKADFNQCTGRQLIGALRRASASIDHRHRDLPFVLIGHSKIFTRRNEATLRPFLAHIVARPNEFQFANLAGFAPVSAIPAGE